MTSFPFRGLRGWLRGWRYATLGYGHRWMRKEHAAERLKALRWGFEVRMEPIEETQCVYLQVLVPDEDEVGAIRLVGEDQDYTAVIHRDSKGKGGWQVSYFCERLPGEDEHYPTLQEALDSARNGGMAIQVLMTTDGELKG